MNCENVLIINVFFKFCLTCFSYLNQEILGYYEILRVQFPNAELQASTLEDYFVAALPIKDSLPVLTTEIGDTWIQGVASDPRKCAEYRAVSRVLRNCLLSGLY